MKDCDACPFEVRMSKRASSTNMFLKIAHDEDRTMREAAAFGVQSRNDNSAGRASAWPQQNILPCNSLSKFDS